MFSFNRERSGERQNKAPRVTGFKARLLASMLLLLSSPAAAFASTDQGTKLSIEPYCNTLEDPNDTRVSALVVFRDSIPSRRIILGFRLANSDSVEASSGAAIPKRSLEGDELYPVYPVYTDPIGYGETYANFTGLARGRIRDHSSDRVISLQEGDELEVTAYEAQPPHGSESLASFIINPTPIGKASTVLGCNNPSNFEPAA